MPNILIELGFLDYVAYRKKKGKTKLPQEELQMLNIFSQLPQEKKNDFCKNYK